MTDKEVYKIHDLISENEPENVLEWGSGGSTIYFPYRHPEINKWIALEDDPDWHDFVRRKSHDKVTTLYIEEQDYYCSVLDQDKSFDMIIVDGRFRRACMVVASIKLNKGGFVLLHDSNRPQYKSSFGLFDKSLQLTDDEELKIEGFPASHQGLHLFWNEESE